MMSEDTQWHVSVGGGAVDFLRDVLRSNLRWKIGCFCGFSWYSSAIPGDYRESTEMNPWTFYPEAEHLAVSSVKV